MRAQAAGFSTSALMHGVLGLILYSLMTSAPEVRPSVVIDLSLLARPSVPAVAETVPVRESVAVAPAVPRVEPEVTRQEVVPPRKQKKIVKKFVKPLPEVVQLPVPLQRAAVVEEMVATTSEVPETKGPSASAAPETLPVAQSAMAGSEGEAFTQAKGRPAAAQADGTDNTLTAEESWRQEHFNFIKEAIRKNMTYPVMARRNGWQGRVLVSFVICQDGQVKDIRVEKSSGFALLDKNAVTIIKLSAPFPNPPVRATLIVPIDYTFG